MCLVDNLGSYGNGLSVLIHPPYCLSNLFIDFRSNVTGLKTVFALFPSLSAPTSDDLSLSSCPQSSCSTCCCIHLSKPLHSPFLSFGCGPSSGSDSSGTAPKYEFRGGLFPGSTVPGDILEDDVDSLRVQSKSSASDGLNLDSSRIPSIIWSEYLRPASTSFRLPVERSTSSWSTVVAEILRISGIWK
jgi:hypothetical protein